MSLIHHYNTATSIYKGQGKSSSEQENELKYLISFNRNNYKFATCRSPKTCKNQYKEHHLYNHLISNVWMHNI